MTTVQWTPELNDVNATMRSTEAAGDSGDGTTGAVAGGAAALQVSGIAKSFHGKTVLHPFELSIRPGEIHMFLGQNGSGKSTLIKILSGFHRPDTGGEVLVGGAALSLGAAGSSHALGLRFVHQDLGLIDDASILDNLSFGDGYPSKFLTINSKQARARTAEKLRGVGLDLHPLTPAGELSAAQRTGVAVARALDAGGSRARLIVLDEPTATLPTEDVQHLHRMLRSAAADGLAVLYVTHHLDEVHQLGDYVHVLRDGHLVHSSAVGEVDQETLVHRLIGGELEAVARRLAADEMPDTYAPVAMQVSGLESATLKGVDLQVVEGEVLGIYGLTGSGRESILGAVFGALPRGGGKVMVKDTEVRAYSPVASMRAGLGYVPPDRKTHGGFMDLTAAENLSITNLEPYWSRGSLRSARERKDVEEWFERLDVRPRGRSRSPMASFSGGNQQKIVMGKWLRLDPKVLLLDEPTQGVDVGAKAGLHRQVLAARAKGTAVVISSTDVEELATLSDRVLIMRNGRVSHELVGDDVNETNINKSFHVINMAPKVE